MGITTTYYCDATGKQSMNKAEFVEIDIKTTAYHKDSGFTDYSGGKTIKKLISREVAEKYHLINIKETEDTPPEPTLEAKLMMLFRDVIVDIATEAGAEAGYQAAQNR